MYLSALPVLWISNATESLRPPTLHDLPPSLTAAPTAAAQPSSRTGRCEQAPPAPHGPWRWRLRSKQGSPSHVGLWCSDCSVWRGAQRIAICGRLAPPGERSEARGGAVWSQVAIPRVAGSDARLSSWLWCCVCATGYTAGGPSVHWEVRSAPSKRLMTVNCFLWSSERPFADCPSPGFAPPAAMCRPPRAPKRIILAGESSVHGAVLATRGGRL